MKGAILIVSRNNLALTKSAIRSALLQDPACDVLVIDNNSSDGTKDWLKSKVGIGHMSLCPQVSLAFCWNMGIRVLQGMGHESVLVLNNDVEIPPHFYTSLLYWLKANRHGFVTGVSVGSRSAVGTEADWSYQFSPHPDFSAFLISRFVTEVVGWFDEKYYPAYCEDADYHVRMHREGIKAGSICVPFYHDRSQTLKTAGDGERDQIQRGADANRERFRGKYGCLPGTPEYEELFK